MSSLVWMRSPSGSRPGSDFTRDPVARMTSLALEHDLPDRLIGIVDALDPHARRPVEATAPADVVDAVLADEAEQALVEPLDDLLAPRRDGHRVDRSAPLPRSRTRRRA